MRKKAPPKDSKPCNHFLDHANLISGDIINSKTYDRYFDGDCPLKVFEPYHHYSYRANNIFEIF